MAFESTITDSTVFGDKRVVYGTFTNGSGDMGGDVATGMVLVEQFFIQKTGSSTAAVTHSVNETFPLSSGAVTIVTLSNEDGNWLAIGK